MEKTPNIYRIFAYGGSSTAGCPFGHWGSFLRILGEHLQSLQRTDVEVEVVNFGAGGFGSSRVRTLVERTLKYEPDLVIIYSGHNEHCDHHYLLEAKGEEAARQSTSMRLAMRLARYSSTIKLALLSMHATRIPTAPSEPFRSAACNYSRDLPADTRMRRLFARLYRRNMTAIAEMVQQSRAKLLLVSQISNDMLEPTEYSQTELSVAGEYFRSARSAIESGNHAFALQLLRLARDQDLRAHRAESSYAKMLKQIADRYSSAFFADAEKWTRRRLEDGLLDGRVILDVMHPSITGHAFIAEAILELYFYEKAERSDLFDYAKQPTSAIWARGYDLSSYHLMCKRYVGTPDWTECLDKMWKQYQSAESTIERRLRSRVGEGLYFFGVLYHDAEKRRRARELYDSPWQDEALMTIASSSEK